MSAKVKSEVYWPHREEASLPPIRLSRALRVLSEAAQRQTGGPLGPLPGARAPVAEGGWSPWAGAGKKSWLPPRVQPALECWMVGLEGEAGIPKLLSRV